MTQASFEEIAAVLRSQQTFAVLSHVRPDGDALGSQLGLGLSLSKLGKTVMVRNEDGLLEKYGFLPGGEFLQTPLSEPQDFDVAIALDTATQSRLGTATSLVRRAKTWINIDHHPSNPGYGDLVYIDSSAPATGQILFELITSQGLPMDAAIAENLFVAISTDTGIRTRPRAPSRSARSCCTAASTSAGSANCFTKIIRGAARNCSANFSARCASKARAKSRALA
jgi:phosphoesterase RecJ-like protein